MGTTETGTHTFILVFLRKHPSKGKECGVHSNLCYLIVYRLSFFRLPIPSHTDLLPNVWWMGATIPQPTTQLTSPRACPRARCILVGWVSLGGWQSGIEGSSPSPILGGLADCPVARPPYRRLGWVAGTGERFLVGLGSVALGSSGLFFLSHTHSHLCLCPSLIPDRTNGSSMDTAEVWDFPNLGLGDYLNG